MITSLVFSLFTFICNVECLHHKRNKYECKMHDSEHKIHEFKSKFEEIKMVKSLKFVLNNDLIRNEEYSTLQTNKQLLDDELKEEGIQGCISPPSRINLQTFDENIQNISLTQN